MFCHSYPMKDQQTKDILTQLQNLQFKTENFLQKIADKDSLTEEIKARDLENQLLHERYNKATNLLKLVVASYTLSDSTLIKIKDFLQCNTPE